MICFLNTIMHATITKYIPPTAKNPINELPSKEDIYKLKAILKRTINKIDSIPISRYGDKL